MAQLSQASPEGWTESRSSTTRDWKPCGRSHQLVRRGCPKTGEGDPRACVCRRKRVSCETTVSSERKGKGLKLTLKLDWFFPKAGGIPEILGVPPPFFPGMLLFRNFLESLQKPGETGWFSKRTMVEKNGQGNNP